MTDQYPVAPNAGAPGAPQHRRRYEANLQHVEHTGAAEYDHSDLGARGIVWFLVGLAVVVGLVHLMIWGFMTTYERFEPKPPARTAAATIPAVEGSPANRFAAPVLQFDETGDMDRYREQIDQQLNSYGWVDEKAGVAHIPVERAMELMAQRGLPVRPQTQSGGTAPQQGSKQVAQ